MLGRSSCAGKSALIAVVAALALAIPSVAAAKPSLASVKRDVHAAKVSFGQFGALARHRPSAAGRALARAKTQTTIAANAARGLRTSANHQIAAQGLTLVANQYGSELNVLTSLVPSTTGSLQAQIVQVLTNALSGQTQVLDLLRQLAPQLSAPAAGGATNTIGNLLSGSSGDLQSLSGLLGGQLPTGIQSALGNAITTGTTMIDSLLTQIKSLIPSLPAQAQPIATQILTQVEAAFGQLTTTLQQIAQQLSGQAGGSTSGGGSLTGAGSLPGLGQISGLLQQLLGGLGGTGGLGGLGGSGGLGGLTGLTGLTGLGGLGGLGGLSL